MRLRGWGLAAALTLVPALGLVLAPGTARAQMDSREGIALQNQILELRRDMQTMQAQRGGGAVSVAPPVSRGGGGGGSDLSAQLLDRVATLEDEVRRLRGRVDELANSTKRAQDDLAKQIGDINFRQQNGAGGAAPSVGGGVAAGTVPTVERPGAGGNGGSTATAKRPPELAMQEGNAALARRDYAVAESDAREVMAAGRGPRTADAQFLLAQALTGKRDYQGAAVAYDDAYNRSRTGSRAPEALLGVANSLLALNDKPAACGSLDKLRAEFPSARSEVREGAAALRGRAGCR